MQFEWEQLLPNTYQPTAEILEAHQLTYEFHREVKSREEFEHHCQWYSETAELHQEELQKMRGDLNILGWFLRGRGTTD